MMFVLRFESVLVLISFFFGWMVLDITTSLPTSSHVMFDLEILTKIVLTDIRFIICSQLQSHLLTQHLPSLKLTFLAPENGWLEDDPLLLGEAYFQGLLLLVSGRVLLQWNMDPLKVYFLLRIGIFHCYVSIPEGTVAISTLSLKTLCHRSQAIIEPGISQGKRWNGELVSFQFGITQLGLCVVIFQTWRSLWNLWKVKDVRLFLSQKPQ